MIEENFDQKSDEELARLSSQNQRFFLYIVKRYEKALMRYIRRVSNFSFEEAEDILQEIFIKVYRNLNDFDESLKFSSWVYRIAHNHIISSFRKKSSRAEGFVFDFEDEKLNNISSELDINKELDSKITRKVLLKVLVGMDRKYREVLILKFFEEKDYKEISDIIKKPMGTVATLLNRAKKKLAAEIEKQEIKL